MGNAGLRQELAELLGIDLEAASIADRMKLDRVLTLRLYISDRLAAQERGAEVDVRELEAASRMLDGLLPQPQKDGPAAACDMSRLGDKELALFERLCAKAFGESVEDIAVDAAPPAANSDHAGELLEAREELERLRWQAAMDAAEIELLKAQLEAALKPADEDEEKALQLIKDIEAFIAKKDAASWE